MPDIKRLNEVLPPEQRLIDTVSLAAIVDKPLIVHEAAPLAADKPSFWMATVEVEKDHTRYKITVSQQQIISTFKWLIDNKALPVLVMIVNLGKSYAVVDPVDYHKKD